MARNRRRPSGIREFFFEKHIEGKRYQLIRVSKTKAAAKAEQRRLKGFGWKSVRILKERRPRGFYEVWVR